MRRRKRRFTFDKSMRLYKEALQVLPAGVSSNARLWLKLCPTYVPCSIFINRGVGSHVWDVDGNGYVDYRLGFGPVILGHSYPAVVRKVHAAEGKGSVYAFDNELEVDVAKKVRFMVHCAEMVRYSLTGTEATMAVFSAIMTYAVAAVFWGMSLAEAHKYLGVSCNPRREEPEARTCP